MIEWLVDKETVVRGSQLSSLPLTINDDDYWQVQKYQIKAIAI